MSNELLLLNITFLFMECYKDFFIHNFKFYPCEEFNETLLSPGTSIYEVIRIEEGIPLFLEDHLNRLFYSLDASHLSINESYCDIDTLISELIKKNNTKEGKIKLIIQFDKINGFKERNLFIYFTPHYFPSEQEYTQGVTIGLCQATRLNPNAKILNTEARKKANNTILEEKLFEVLLINNEGFINEGSRSNIFFIKGNRIITPPEKDVLNGVTRRNILRICRKNNIEIAEEKIQYSDIQHIDAAFLTGTSIKVLPVKFIVDTEFNINHTSLQRIRKLYDESIVEYIKSRI